MPRLTPNKIIILRQRIVALIGSVNIQPAIDWCKAKNEELGNHLDINTLLKIFESQGMVQFLDNSKVQEVSEEEIEQREAIISTENRYIDNIINHTKLERKTIIRMVEDKKTELKGLISTEGALFIISKELGIDQKEKPKLMSSLEYAEAKHNKPNVGKQITIAARPAAVSYDRNKLKKEDYKNMKDFWDRQEDSSDFSPFLKIKNAITFTLELIDNESEPRQGVDGYGNNQIIFDVILRDVSPKKALQDVNKDGFLLYTIDRTFAFAIKTPGRSKDRMKEMWQNSGPISTFTFMRKGSSFQTDYEYNKVN